MPEEEPSRFEKRFEDLNPLAKLFVVLFMGSILVVAVLVSLLILITVVGVAGKYAVWLWGVL
jgi:hypothetical protein